jgi:hypothetical protein
MKIADEKLSFNETLACFFTLSRNENKIHTFKHEKISLASTASERGWLHGLMPKEGATTHAGDRRKPR